MRNAITAVSAFLSVILLSSETLADAHAASGDAAEGEAAFSQCQACHIVQNDEGEVLAGGNGRAGPNLYAIAGRAAGTVEGFRYSSALEEAGKAGLVWDEANFAAYVQDPTGFLREFLNSSKARGRMAFRVRDAEDATDLYAYLASLGNE